jgi:hypothetical protein
LVLEKEASSFLGSIPEGDLSELKNVSEECLQKAGLVELKQKLITLSEACKA